MILTTKRLILKPADITYLHSTFEYAGNLENTKMMMFLPYDSLEETAEILKQSEENWKCEKPEFLHFVIIFEDRHIGEISLYFIDDPTKAELGWVIHRDYWNKGIVTEAAFEMLEYAKTLGIKCVFACCDSENAGSYRVMEKIGMRRVSSIGGRKNRASCEERTELTYEIYL